MADHWTAEDEARYLAGVATADVPASVRDYMATEESFPDHEPVTLARPDAQRDAMDTEDEAAKGRPQRDDALDRAVWDAMLRHEATRPEGGHRGYAEGGEAEIPPEDAPTPPAPPPIPAGPPPFDPSKPFAVGTRASLPPPFDPSKPFSVKDAPSYTLEKPFEMRPSKTQEEAEALYETIPHGAHFRLPGGEIRLKPKQTPEAQAEAEAAASGVDYSGFGQALPKPPGWVGTAAQSFGKGAVEAAKDIAHAPTAFADTPPAPADESPVGKLLQTPLSEGYTDPKWYIAQIAHGAGGMTPLMGAGAVGAGVGSVVPGVGTAAGAVVGFAGAAAAGALRPAFERARAAGYEWGDAVQRSILDSGLAAAVAAVMPAASKIALFGRAPITDAAGNLTRDAAWKIVTQLEHPVSEALGQLGLVQPGLMLGQQAGSAAITQGRAPTAEELATGYISGAGGGAAFVAGHHLARGAMGRGEQPATGGQTTPGTTPPAGAPPPGGPPPVGEAFGMDVGRGVEPVRVAEHTPEGDVVLEDAEGQKHPMAAADVARLRQEIPAPEPGAAPVAAVEPPAPPAAAVEAPVPVPAAEPVPPAAPAAAPVTRVTPPAPEPPARSPDVFGDEGSVMANLDRIGAEIEAGPEAERAKLEAVVAGVSPEADAPPVVGGGSVLGGGAEGPAAPSVVRPAEAADPYHGQETPEEIIRRMDERVIARMTDARTGRVYEISPWPGGEGFEINTNGPEGILYAKTYEGAVAQVHSLQEGAAFRPPELSPEPPEPARPLAIEPPSAAAPAPPVREEPPAPVVAPEPVEAAPAPAEARAPEIPPENEYRAPGIPSEPSVPPTERPIPDAPPPNTDEIKSTGSNPIVSDEKHTKTGKDIYAVRFPVKPMIDDLGMNARRLGGYWSSFRGNGMQPGWMFKTREAADKFANWARGKIGENPGPRETEAERQATAVENLVEAGDVTRVTPEEAPTPLDMDQIESEIQNLIGDTPQGMDPELYRLRREVAAARNATDEAPTDAQKESGNYAKGRVRLAPGLDFVMENPEGSYRRGVDPNGEPWEVKLPADYGYFSRTEGADGDHVDAYLGPDLTARTAYVVDQVQADTGAFDEHKVLYGFDSWPKARAAYEDAFSDGRGAERLGSVTPMDIGQLREWLRTGDTKNPVGQQALSFETRVPTSEPISPVEETGHGIQGTLPPGAAGTRPEAVHGAEEIRPTREPSAPEDRGGLQPAGSDAGERPGAERGEAPGSGGDRAGAADRVPAAREPTEPGTPRRPVEPAREIDLSEPGEIAKPADTGRAVDLIQGQNHVIEPGTLAEARGPVVKARDNIAAIELAKRLIEDGRPATREEQAQLAQYTGWGGLSGAFPDSRGNLRKGFEDIGARLKELLSPKEYDAAARSTQYAHYTSEPVIRSMWDAVAHLGFKGGNVFEPGMGVGHFLGMMPADMAKASRYQGIEIDPLTAQIAKLLYPESGVRQADFIRTPLPENAFDLAIGNPPFADIVVQGDPKYTARGFLLHDYFFAKSLDSVRPGGLLAFVTSAGTMNKLDDAARRFMAERAEFVGGVRLPSTAFAKSAGTEVTTDILFFKKHPFGQQDLGNDAPAWTETVARTLPNAQGSETQGNVSRYFSEHPEQVLGQEGFFDKLYKDRYAVHENPEAGDLETQLRAAMGRLPADIMADAPTPEQKAALDFSSTEHKDGSFYLQNGQLMQYINGAGKPVARRGAGVEGGFTAKELETIRQLVPIRDALREVYAADIAEDGPGAAAARQKLNRFYDDFVAKNGPINKSESTYRRPSRVQQEGARSEAREEARELGNEFQEGDFDAQPLIAKGMKMAEIARLRDAARERTKQQGREFDEGTFDPDAMPDLVSVKRQNIDPFGDDPESYRLRAIEEYDERTGEASKRRIFRESVLTRQQDPEIRSAHDGVLWSLNKFGTLDIDKIAEKTGSNREAVISELGDRVFRLPQTRDSYQISDEYLSGDVVSKLELARTEAERDPAMARNVAALEKVQPAPLSPAEIEIRLGMPWIPLDVVRRFMTERLGLGERDLTYSPHFGKWIVDKGGRYNRSYGTGEAEWSTQKVPAHELLDNALNRVAPKAYDTWRDANGSHRELNPEATQAAQDKVEAMRQAFVDWAYANPELIDQLGRIYNQKYNRVVLRDWNGDYLTTPGISSDWSWRPHQTRGIARVIQSGNTYMGHAVGAGKTSVAIGSAMEMRRLGLVNKPMVVVPNHMLGQFAKEWYEQYPTARLMIADERRFHTDRRRQFVADVGQQDLDGVVITNSAFKRIGVSREFESHLINEAIAELDEAMTALGQDPNNLTKISPDAAGNRITVKKLQNRKQKLEEKLRGHMAGEVDQTNTFEELGIDFLFVDEAHQFRKLSYTTQQNLKGIDPTGSDMAWDLYAKTRYLDSRKPGRSLVLMSGTPITNTMGELYTVSRYLQPQALAEHGVNAFDAWAQTFGDTKTELEQTAQGTYEPVTRFSQMTNVPELYKMVGQVMDVVTPTELSQYVTRPEVKGGERQFHLAPRTPWLEEFQRGLAARVEAIRERKGPPSKGDDILLSVINDGRLGSIDPRLVDPSQPNDPSSKLNQAIENIHQIWKDTANQQFYQPETKKPLFRGPATQLVFSNLGINGREQPDGRPGFSGYRWMRSELIRRGVPSDQIAFIKDYDTPLAKQRLFNDVNEGKVRILIGSTQKMGTGLNVQRRLSAVHNLDPLWFPADDEQRVGRILRQGNLNPEIEIHDYSTKGTYDSTMWQMMGRKGRFIEQFFRGDPELRNMEDLGEASMYEQASAMSTSDERAIKLTELRQELQKTERRQSAHDSEQFGLRWQAQSLTEGIAHSEQSARRYEGDIAQRRETGGDKFAMKVGNQTFQKRAEASEALQKLIDETFPTMAQNTKLTIGEIGGFPLVMTKQFDSPTITLTRADGGFSPWLGERGQTGRGAIRDAERWLGDLEYNRDAMWRQKAEQEQKLAATDGQIGKTFPDGDKIEPLRAQVAALEAELQAAKQAQPFDWNEFAVEIEKNGEAKGPDGKSYKLRAGYSRRGPASYSLMIDDEYAGYGTKPELMERIRREATPPEPEAEAAPPAQGRDGLAERDTAPAEADTPARDVTEDMRSWREARPPGLLGSHEAARDFVSTSGRETGHEYFGGVNPRTGEIVDAGTSDHPSQIMFSDATLERLWAPGGEAMDYHHNHPGNLPASTPDIAMLAAPNLRWIVAHGHDGEMLSAAQLTPEARQWLDGMPPRQGQDALIELSLRAGDIVDRGFSGLVESGRITAEQADHWMREATNTALAGAGAIDYMSSHALPQWAYPYTLRAARALAERLPWQSDPEVIFDRVHRSAGAVSSQAGMGRLSGADAGAAAAGRPASEGRDPGSAIRPEAEAQPTVGGLAEETGSARNAVDAATEDALNQAVARGRGPIRRVLDAFGVGRNSAGSGDYFFNPVNKEFTTPLGLARLDPDRSGVKDRVENDRRMSRDRYLHGYVETLDSFRNGAKADQDAVLRAAEVLTLEGRNVPADGRAVIVGNTEYPLARLSKVGDDLSLRTPERIKMFGDLSRTMERAWDDRIAAVAKLLGWEGEPTYGALMRAAEDAVGKEKGRLERAAAIIASVEYQRRTAYLPLMRRGDYFMRVVPKNDTPDRAGIPGWDGEGFAPTAWFELIDSRSPWERFTGGKRSGTPGRATDAMAELRKTFPEGEYDIEHGYMFRKGDQIKDLPLPAVEKLMMLIGNDVRGEFERTMTGEVADAEYQGAVNSILKQVAGELKGLAGEQIRNARMAGPLRQRKGTSGYDGDFVESIGRYLNWGASSVAGLDHGQQIEQANLLIHGGTDSTGGFTPGHPDPQVQDFWRKWDRRHETPSGPLDQALVAARQGAFFWTIGGNAASALKNLLDGPMLGMPVLSTGMGATGRARAYGDYITAGTQLLKGVRVGKNGLDLDFMAGARTDAERAMLRDAQATGLIHNPGMDELGALTRKGEDALLPQQKFNRRVLEIWASAFGLTEKINRSTLLLAAHRLASREGMEKINQAWNKDGVWKNSDKTPEAFARFMVERSQGRWGIDNKTGFARTQLGGMLMQFRSFEQNMVSTIHQQLWHMGPEGKVTAMLMLGTMGTLAGALGLPFVQDIEKAYEWTHKLITGVDPNLEEKWLQFMKDDPLGLGANAGKTALHGLQPFGIDLGSVGVGNPLSRSQSALDMAGAAASIFLGAPYRAHQRSASGQSDLAAWAELAPNGIKNLVRAYGVYPDEGVRSISTGKTSLRPQDISDYDKTLKAMGFRSKTEADAAYESEREYRLTEQQKQKAHALNVKIDGLFVSSMLAKNRGDTAEAARLNAEVTRVIQAAPAGIRPSMESIRNAMRQAINPQAAAVKAAPKAVRGQVAQPIYGQPPP